MALFGREFGSRTGGGGPSSAQQEYIDRRERLRQLALEKIDLDKDPYFMRNHLGWYECKLCLTLHNNEGSYLAHTQGKRHQSNLSRRAAKEAKDTGMESGVALNLRRKTLVRKSVKIGRPGYRVTKQRDPASGAKSLLFEIDYPEIEDGLQPRHRFMSAYEQRVDLPPDKNYQYILFAAEPYETVGFKIPNREIERNVRDNRFFSKWDTDSKRFLLQLFFRTDGASRGLSAPAPPVGGYSRTSTVSVGGAFPPR